MLGIDFPLGPRTGKELRYLFNHFVPFNIDGKLKETSRLVTLLAANSNYPNEIQTNAFMQAAAHNEGSPMIIQYSYTSLTTEGADKDKQKLTNRKTQIRPTAVGAATARFLLTKYASLYGADMVFMALDHFTAPGLDKITKPKRFDELALKTAMTKVGHAAEIVKSGNIITSEDDIRKYAGYICSPEYQSFRADFLAAIRWGNPAWAMIDTGNLPAALNFATTRDITNAVRNELNNHDVILEAELSATGQSGEESGYVYWKDLDRKERFAELELTKGFIAYTRAEAIAYEIGMKHATKKGEYHEPDEEKQSDIQSELCHRVPGRYIPFVQHGGSGSSKIVRGLTAKLNVNTEILHAGAMEGLKHVDKNRAGIENREKAAIGNTRFYNEIEAGKTSVVGYMKATGTAGLAPRLRESFDVKSPELNEYNGTQAEGKE